MKLDILTNNVIDFVTIATLGDAIDFGDMQDDAMNMMVDHVRWHPTRYATFAWW